LRRRLVHIVELDKKELDAARAVIACVELESVRITRSRFVTTMHGLPLTPVELATSSRTEEVTEDESLCVILDLVLRGYKDEAVLLEVSASIEAVYSIPPNSSFSPYQLKCFAKANGMLNVWPYWRDFVQSSVLRAGLPPLALPLFRVIHKRPTGGLTAGTQKLLVRKTGMTKETQH